MNDAALDRLRVIDPVPADPGMPPIEHVRALIASDERSPAPRGTRRRGRRRLIPGSVAPALGAIAVVAVAAAVAGAILLVHPHTHPASPTFAHGMRGTVTPSASGVDGDNGYIWFSRRRGSSYWLATTIDAGRSWTVTRRRELLIPPVSGAGASAWAAAAGDDPRGLQGGGIVVTHDRGHSWQVVHAARSPSPYSVSVAGGEVWAVGDGCPGVCGGGVLRGPVSGSRLAATPTIPRVGRRAVQIVALSASSAYLYVPFGGGRAEAWVTADAGQTWQRVTAGCRSYAVSGSGSGSGSGDGSIWRSCAPSSGHAVVGISTDGGRRWVYRPASFSTGILYPESAQTAWAQTRSGATLRTTDGARSWDTVWTPPSARLPGLDARSVTLSAESATTATEVVPVVRTNPGTHTTYTNLLLYRTTDGGRSWHETRVQLPAR